MLSVQNLSFSYHDKPAVSDVAFTVDSGSQVALIGESGCGKSTLLKLLYGIFDPGSGSVSFDGKPIFGPKSQLLPGAPFMQYLAQDFGLMPYATSAENVGVALSNSDKPKKNARIAALLELVEMSEFATTKPQLLSGGQQQRIALAKALASRPELLLLDEPFSQIDLFRANTLRRNLFNYFKIEGVTVLMATHDSADVLSFCDGAIVMKSGKIIAEGRSGMLYKNPPSRYVASLFGDVSEIKAPLLKHEGAPLLVYPHQLEVVRASPLMATVKHSYFLGNGFRMECVYASGTLYFDAERQFPAGSLVHLALREK